MRITGRVICRWVLSVFAIAYLAALALLAIGTFGLFGQPLTPLSGVYLLPLGLPWNLLLDRVPAPLLRWLVVLSPILNFLFLWVICAAVSRRRTATHGG